MSPAVPLDVGPTRLVAVDVLLWLNSKSIVGRTGGAVCATRIQTRFRNRWPPLAASCREVDPLEVALVRGFARRSRRGDRCRPPSSPPAKRLSPVSPDLWPESRPVFVSVTFVPVRSTQRARRPFQCWRRAPSISRFPSLPSKSAQATGERGYLPANDQRRDDPDP